MSLRSIQSRGVGRVLSALTAVLMVGSFAAPVLAQEQLSGTIRFSWWGANVRNEKTEQIIKLFESENPGVTISREPGEFNAYWDKLNVQAASGNQPCAITMQSRLLAQYADPSILRPLDDLVENGTLDVSGIEPAVLDSGRGADGKLYFIPHGVFYFALLMNKTAIEAAGMQIPPNDWTWDDLEAFARELKTKIPADKYAFGNLGGNMNAFGGFLIGKGEAAFAPDGTVSMTPETIAEWFTRWEALRKEGVTETADLMAELPDNFIDNTLLAKGVALVDARPANQLDGHQKVLDVAKPGEQLVLHTLPVGEKGGGNDIGANGFAIGANCDENSVKIAAAWTNFFTQDERAADIYLSDNGVVTVDRFREKQLKNEKATPGQRQLIEVFNEVAPTAKTAFYPAGGYNAMNETLTSTYESVAFGKATPEEAAASYIDQVQRATEQ